MNGKTDDQTITNFLDAHAESIQSGLSEPSALPAASEADLEVLRPLMHLAERIAQVLIPVEPSPVFIASLELELGRAIHRPQPSLLTRYRKTILVSLAALGSALSVTSIILFYFLRLRTATHTSQAS